MYEVVRSKLSSIETINIKELYKQQSRVRKSSIPTLKQLAEGFMDLYSRMNKFELGKVYKFYKVFGKANKPCLLIPVRHIKCRSDEDTHYYLEAMVINPLGMKLSIISFYPKDSVPKYSKVDDRDKVPNEYNYLFRYLKLDL